MSHRRWVWRRLPSLSTPLSMRDEACIGPRRTLSGTPPRSRRYGSPTWRPTTGSARSCGGPRPAAPPGPARRRWQRAAGRALPPRCGSTTWAASIPPRPPPLRPDPGLPRSGRQPGPVRACWCWVPGGSPWYGWKCGAARGGTATGPRSTRTGATGTRETTGRVSGRASSSPGRPTSRHARATLVPGHARRRACPSGLLQLNRPGDGRPRKSRHRHLRSRPSFACGRGSAGRGAVCPCVGAGGR